MSSTRGIDAETAGEDDETTEQDAGAVAVSAVALTADDNSGSPAQH
jgi:hypothetical protein